MFYEEEEEIFERIPQNAFKLIVLEQDSKIKIFPLNKTKLMLGRSSETSECEIQVESPLVSRRHGCFIYNNGKYYYVDYPNSNGTYYNGVKISRDEDRSSQLIELYDGDVLRIDSGDLDSPESNGVVIIFSVGDSDKDIWKSFPLSSMEKEVLIGRKVPEGNIEIPKPMVSRFHAKIIRTSQGYVLGDLKSVSGTLLNGSFVEKPVLLKQKDIINICSSKLIYMNDMLIYNVPKSGIQAGVELKIDNISKEVFVKTGEKRKILNNISLTIRPGELVAIVGASGAGKTTFMNAICGFERATSGNVYINDNDLYKNYDIHKTQIGYVPQNDIIHDNLTIENMLEYTARLRLPKDISSDEINYQVDSVIDIMGLNEHREKLIRKLSGGQRKRASIASELISDPAILFMDEPTSGLDPESDINLIKYLKKLASVEGKTIVLITHTLQNIYAFDKIIFLAAGGYLTFFGGLNEALEFFEVNNLVEAYEKISKEPQVYIRKYAERSLQGN